MNWTYFIVIVVILFVGFLVLKLIIEKQKSEDLLPYRSKCYLFTRSELEFLRALNLAVDKERYMIFPKVRLADFVEVTLKGKEYQGWWNKIRSKHIDFLIWDVQENKIALAIELDGKSHGSAKMQERDAFVEKLYETIDVDLKRVKVGTNFTAEADNVSTLLKT